MIQRLQATISSLHKWLINKGLLTPPGESNGGGTQHTDEQQAAQNTLLDHSLQRPRHRAW